MRRFQQCWRDRAIARVIAVMQAHRLLFNNPESFCFDAKFSSESFVLKLKLENVAFAM